MYPEITDRSADLVVVGLGGNDAFELNRPGRWRRDVGRLIAALQSRLPAAHRDLPGAHPRGKARQQDLAAAPGHA